MKRKIPGPVGGKLIRKVIAEFKKNKLSLPLDSHILCAVSGGADSIALAHLICTYGKKIAGQGVSIVHVNHSWRSTESDSDEAFVNQFAKTLSVRFYSRSIRKDLQFTKGASPEERARSYRKKIFEELSSEQSGSFVLTAHHYDDVSETILWKLLTGAPSHEWGGIKFLSGIECRPFINVTKKEIIQYLKEEKLSYRTDSTNFDPKFLRANIRKTLVPALDQVFPQWRKSLVNLTSVLGDTILPDELGCLLGAGGTKIRGQHWKEVQRQAKSGNLTSIDLPNGAKLTHNIKEGTWILKPGKKEKQLS